MSRDGRRRRALILAAATLSLVTAASMTIPDSASAADDRKAPPGTKPAWATDTVRTESAQTKSAQQIDARVWLAGRDPQATGSYARAVSDPSSSQYRHFLTPAQYRQRFGPT